MNAIRGIVVAAILLTASQAHATLYTLVFTDLGVPSEWLGTYDQSPAAGFLVSALIGTCVRPYDCTYDDNIGLVNPIDGRGGFEILTRRDDCFFPVILNTCHPYGSLHLVPHNSPGPNRLWATDNQNDIQPHRVGSYCVVGVDGGCALPATGTVHELSSIWLILAGAGLIAASKFRIF